METTPNDVSILHLILVPLPVSSNLRLDPKSNSRFTSRIQRRALLFTSPRFLCTSTSCCYCLKWFLSGALDGGNFLEKERRRRESCLASLLVFHFAQVSMLLPGEIEFRYEINIMPGPVWYANSCRREKSSASDKKDKQTRIGLSMRRVYFLCIRHEGDKL